MDIQSIISIVTNPEYIKVVLSVLGVASVVATMTKNKADNKVVNLLLKAINALACNFGKAKNKD